MAYDYNKSKKLYEQMTEQQQQQFAQQNKNDPNYQQFMNDYTNDANRVNKVTAPTSPYQNQWAGNYSYNQQSGYYEKAPWNYQNQWEWQYIYDNNSWYYQNTTKPQTNQYTDYSKYNNTNNSDFYWNQNNTNQNTNSAMGQIMSNSQKYQTGYSNLMWWGSNYAGSFDEAVANKLKSAYWINSLEEFKQRYPEQYESLSQYLESVRWVRDATDPNSRQMLDGQLQGIIWAGVGAGSETSKLKVLESTIMDKFQNPEQIKQDAQNVIRLQTEWKNIGQIAKEMWISEDQVQQLVLLANGLDSKAWEYYQLKADAAKDITEPFDTKLDRAEQEKNIALERANRQLERLKEDFDTNMERQKKANEVNLHNADFLSWQYGYWFSKRGIEWLQYTAQQAQNIIDDLVKNYDRNNIQITDQISDIIRNWERYNEDIEKASEEALTQAKNTYTSNMLAIQQQYGTVGMQAQQYLSQNVQSFITQAENIYDNALVRQQQNLTNLITNAGNLNALATQNLTLRNAKIQQFQAESMNMNRSQLQQLAQQLWMSPEEYGDLANYQVQAVANELNGYLPWAWIQLQWQIQNKLNSWYSPMEALSSIMNSDEFRSMQQVGGNDEWVKLNENTLYNKRNGTFKTFNGESYSDIGSMWNYGSTTNYISSETVNWQTYWISENTLYWLQDFASKHQIGSTWWQCWKFVNDYLESLGLARVFTDPIEKKAAAINTSEWYKPQVWDIVVMDSPSARKYGHVAIVTAVNGDKITTLESNKKWEWEVFSRTIDTSKQDRLWNKIYGYYHPDGVVASNTTSSTGGMWNMSNYDLNIATMRIGAMAYWKNISEKEWERVEEAIRDWAKMWKSQTDILYDVMGMTITNNQDKAEPLINIMIENSDEDGLKWYNVQWFANFINNWNIKWAVNLVEQSVANKQWIWKDMKENEASAIASFNKWNEAIDLINENLNSLWIVAGNWNKQKSKFLKNENFQKIESALTSLVADWRHKMAWSAVTETELKMIDALIPTVKDNPYNAITKIQQLQNGILNELNSQRATLDLPTLDQYSLLDKDKRVELYYWGGLNWWGISPIDTVQNQLTAYNTQTQGRIWWNIRAWWVMSSGKKL